MQDRAFLNSADDGIHLLGLHDIANVVAFEEQGSGSDWRRSRAVDRVLQHLLPDKPVLEVLPDSSIREMPYISLCSASLDCGVSRAPGACFYSTISYKEFDYG